MEVMQLDKQWQNNIKARGMSYAVAARNAEDGLSVAQTVESTLMEIGQLAQRLRELVFKLIMHLYRVLLI